jgi:deoxycytidylate deaminase
MSGPCAKQIVTATIIAADGGRFIGRNDVLHPQSICPRHDLPTGVGYELCQSVCAQTGHAEINAIAAAGPRAFGARLFLEGHTYACDACTQACRQAGILEIIINAPPEAAI